MVENTQGGHGEEVDVKAAAQRLRMKRAERSLRDSEERMNLAAEAAKLGMWVWDVARNEVWMLKNTSVSDRDGLRCGIVRIDRTNWREA